MGGIRLLASVAGRGDTSIRANFIREIHPRVAPLGGINVSIGVCRGLERFRKASLAFPWTIDGDNEKERVEEECIEEKGGQTRLE